MASAFASQLKAISSRSTNELDLKALRFAHGESVLFDAKVACRQDFDTIYDVCIQGFSELCSLDTRFNEFSDNLFSEQSKLQDRDQLSRSEVESLDIVLKRCLALLGGKLQLKPALKTLEWLVRRFKVHVRNVNDLILTILPYHEVGLWATVLSIVPSENVVGLWKWIRPYLTTTWNVPRHALIYAATHNDGFFTTYNRYILDASQAGLVNSLTVKFWSGIMLEALVGRLADTRSGITEVQSQRTEDLLLKVLPIISEGFEVAGCSDLIITCYTIIVILVKRAELNDQVLDSISLLVARSLESVDGDATAALTTLAMIAASKKNTNLPKKLLDILVRLENFESSIAGIAKQFSCTTFLFSLFDTALNHVRNRNVHRYEGFLRMLMITVAHYEPNSLDALANLIINKLVASNSDAAVREILLSVIKHMDTLEAGSASLRRIVSSSSKNQVEIETILGKTVQTVDLPMEATEENINLIDAPDMSPENKVVSADVNMIDTQITVISFLDKSSDEAFRALEPAFAKLVQSQQPTSKFRALSTFKDHTSSARQIQGDDVWISFLLRVALGVSPLASKLKALDLLQQVLPDAQNPRDLDDMVAIHVLVLLTDQEQSIRSVAAKIVSSLQQNCSAVRTSDHVAVLDAVVASLEECVLDADSTFAALRTYGQRENKKSNTNPNIFNEALSAAAMKTCLYRVKVVCLRVLSGLNKRGSSGQTSTTVAISILQQWARLRMSEALQSAIEADIPVSNVSQALVNAVDFKGLSEISKLFKSTSTSHLLERTDLVDALFTFTRLEWQKWSSEVQCSTAKWLHELASSSVSPITIAAQDVLRDVNLPETFLRDLISATLQKASSLPQTTGTKKRRRSSNDNNLARLDIKNTLADFASQISFCLELISSNDPSEKPQLLLPLLDMLNSVKQLKIHHISSPYTTSLCLESINAVLSSRKISTKSTELESIRPEIVIDCLKETHNQQVQNAALMVIASLSVLAPHKMVHNVLPIFTFIGNNMLNQEDEHSVNVVNDAIDRIIPALVTSMRKASSNETFHTSIITMLASFSAAIRHLSQNRRVGFYRRLMRSVGTADLAYVLIAQLLHVLPEDESTQNFLFDLLELESHVQVRIYTQLLHLAENLLSSNPSKASLAVYAIEKNISSQGRVTYATATFNSASLLLVLPSLKRSLNQQVNQGMSNASKTEQYVRAAFLDTLTGIKIAKQTKPRIDGLVDAATRCLSRYLRLLPLSMLLEILRSSLHEMSDDLQAQALRVVASQLETSKSENTSAVQAILLLTQLSTNISSISDTTLLLTTLAAIDKITMVYGRKDLDAIIKSAEAILYRDSRQGQSLIANVDVPAKTATVLTIASMVDVLGEGSIPIVSNILTQMLALVKARGLAEVDATLLRPLCDALCTLAETLVSNVAFVIPVLDLGGILYGLAARLVNDQIDASLFQSLISTIARKVDMSTIVELLQQHDTYGSIAVSDEAIREILLDLLAKTILHNSKAIVTKHTEAISGTIRTAIDMGATTSAYLPSGFEVSKALKEVTINFIYKINDTIFRPVFDSWVEWSQAASDGERKSNTVIRRQIILYGLLDHVFSTLKGIITSYSVSLTKPISMVMSDALALFEPSGRHSGEMSDATDRDVHGRLLISTLSLLTTITKHDRDSIHASPSVFPALVDPLTGLLRLAARKPMRKVVQEQVIPAIVSLANATMDTPSTHHQLASLICALRKDSSSHVRLATIQCLTALVSPVRDTETDEADESLAEEFIANVIGIGSGEGEGARGGSIGEIMIYVNEMLEDDNEDVEMAVRKWVQKVRAKVGEDIFEV